MPRGHSVVHTDAQFQLLMKLFGQTPLDNYRVYGLLEPDKYFKPAADPAIRPELPGRAFLERIPGEGNLQVTLYRLQEAGAVFFSPTRYGSRVECWEAPRDGS